MAKSFDRRLICCITQEMESADALERDDFSAAKRDRDLIESVTEARSADPAGNCLSVEPPVRWVFIVCFTSLAEAEARH